MKISTFGYVGACVFGSVALAGECARLLVQSYHGSSRAGLIGLSFLVVGLVFGWLGKWRRAAEARHQSAQEADLAPRAHATIDWK